MSDAPRHLHVDLDLELGSDPIRGSLGFDPDHPRQFRGWIELAAALEALRNPPAASAAAPDDPR